MKLRIVLIAVLLVGGCGGATDETSPVTAVESTSTSNTSETIAPSDSTTVTSPAPTTTSAPEASVETGAEVAGSAKCIACHSLDGTANDLAPTFLGLAGSIVTLADASTMTADSDYLRKSITDPGIQLVAGNWATSMPSFQFTDEELESLVLYLESLFP